MKGAKKDASIAIHHIRFEPYIHNPCLLDDYQQNPEINTNSEIVDHKLTKYNQLLLAFHLDGSDCILGISVRSASITGARSSAVFLFA